MKYGKNFEKSHANMQEYLRLDRHVSIQTEGHLEILKKMASNL